MIRFLLRIALFTLAALILLPLALVPLYAIPAVHPVSTLMLADYARLRPVSREWADLAEIAPVVIHSVMMSEDARYCSHDGVDWDELNAVIDEALEGESTRGASTIPMQTVKNLFLWPGRSFLRKGMEVPLSLYASGLLSKRRLIEIYLNIAEWDEGIYGIEAAAQHHFGVSASDLSARQAALLAVTLPAPQRRNPAKPSASLNRMAKTIQARAKASGDYIGCVRAPAAEE